MGGITASVVPMQGRVDVSEASTQAGIRSCRSGTVRMAPSKVLIPTEVGHRFRNDAGRWFRFEVGHLFQPSGDGRTQPELIDRRRRMPSGSESLHLIGLLQLSAKRRRRNKIIAEKWG